MKANYQIENSFLSRDGRCIFASIIDSRSLIHICDILNIYAPPNRQDRLPLYHNLLNLLRDIRPLQTNAIITGDFNLHNENLQKDVDQLEWWQWLHSQYFNCISLDNNDNTPTYTSGEHRTTIDYIYQGCTFLISQCMRRSESYRTVMAK